MTDHDHTPELDNDTQCDEAHETAMHAYRWQIMEHLAHLIGYEDEQLPLRVQETADAIMRLDRPAPPATDGEA